MCKGSLIFKGVDVGSILFIYQISEAVKSYLLQYKFIEQDVRFLEGNNITSLIVDSVRIMSSSQPNKVIILTAHSPDWLATAGLITGLISCFKANFYLKLQSDILLGLCYWLHCFSLT